MGKLVGRLTECEQLDRLASEVLTGASRVLVLRSEPGMGKSALLGYLSQRVADWQVVSAVGAESEMELAYSGLHQLCAPLLDHLDELPTEQREAMATVFGLGNGPVPDRFLVGLGTLTLMAQAAEQRPLACIVDDAQWLDQASAQVLAFVARRLVAERVALVCAARTGAGDSVLTGLPELPVYGLSDRDARPLLLDNLHGPLDAAVIDQIVAESHGNPLALLELPRAWRETDLAGGFGLPGDSQAIAGKIERSYARRLELLPAETQLLTLVVAADPVGDPALIRRAADALSVTMAAMEPAVDAGIIRVHDRVEFAHPLARSSVYRAAATADRRRAHQVLAEVIDAQADPDRRAWHRARATDIPDEDVAAELELSADRAAARAGLAAAAAFLTRAAELTPLRAAQTRRALAAASANVQAGAFGTVQSMLTIAESGPIDQLQRAQIELVRAQLAFGSGRGEEAMLLMLAAARRLQPLSLELARQTYLDAFSAAQFAGRLEEGVGTAEVARAAQSAALPPDAERTAGDLLLDAFIAITVDHADAVPRGREALAALLGDTDPARDTLRWLWQGCVLALELWDDESAYILSERHLQRARKTGALTELPLALGSHTPVLVFSGELAAAASLAEEARSVLGSAGIAEAPYGALILGAWRGQVRETKDLIDVTKRAATSRGEGIGVAICEYSRAVLYNGLGQYDEAFEAARDACADPKEMVAHNWAMAELIESAVRTGRADLAQETLTRLTRKAQACRTDWALGIEARSQALLNDEDAEPKFREAIERLGRARVRAELARAHLLYGEWLRRAKRRIDAREELTKAEEMFAAMGMEGFAQRARRELLATGATPRKRTVDTTNELTAQEALVARLARDGMSNPQIGGHLFLSTRTVEWHLSKIFAKLRITSRRQLRQALANHDQPIIGTT
ncbi:helix-turn-helix transcriptional regulator [Micromonospora sp. CB01531]|uniref:helix-turn-helix transcriptional regulator n=1 Tax=Micromonospora sp. CB01531 TaxID=1718947 RepID=UPI00093DF691|nr:LuxR family transcriptional regulator [Micromonospora sp. CB01531]OKI54660.1 LuxR family transcriptional regulator [Micromonospora sp. CB01531]